MSFIDTSVIDNKTVGGGIQAIAVAQKIIPQVLPALSTSTVSAITTAVSTASAGVSTVENGVSSVVKAATTLNPSGLLSAAESAVTSGLTQAISSITSTFGSSVTGLAAGLNSTLSGIFNNTNIASASTTATQLSDPVLTNLLKAPPVSTAFTTNSFQSGSSSVSIAGSSSAFGSLASNMIGTQLSTVMNRLNLDAVNNVGTAVTNAQATSLVSGLLTSTPLSSSLSAISSIAGTVLSTVKTVSSVVSSAETLASNVTTIANAVGNVVANPANDLAVFLGKASELTSVLGSTELSNLYLTDDFSANTLTDQNGTTVDTNGTGIDSVIANAILQIAQSSGCTTSTTSYTSTSTQASLFNVAITAASQVGLSGLVNDLVGCLTAQTTLGQAALSTAFTTSAASQIGIASTIIQAIVSPNNLNTPAVTNTLLTNPNLKASDVGTLTSVLSAIGTTATQAMSVQGISSNDLPVYNSNLISAVQTGVTNTIVGDSTLTDYSVGYPMSLNDTGQLTYNV